MPITTLIAADRLNGGTISEACDHLAAAGCTPAEIEWLEPSCAVDISFSGEVAAARLALAPLEVETDIIVQPAEHRRKMMLVSDMDSTMITVECIDELADYAGIKDQIAEITERAMQGELDFAEALRARVKLLAGLDQALIATCLAELVRDMPGAETLVKTMAGWGAHTVLVSGGFTCFAEPVAARLGFAEIAANELEIVNGMLSGDIIGQIVDADVKRAVLESAAASLGLPYQLIMAVGDGANDIPMITAAGLGIAYHAKPAAAAAADCSIRHNDLTALLYAQGVRRADWWN